MKNKTILFVSTLFAAQIGISQINTPSGVIQGNSGASTNVGIGTTSGVVPGAKLEILGTGNQLRLSNTSTVFSDINTSAAGHLIFQPGTTAGKVAFGIAAPATGMGFHSNMGLFRISDNASVTRALQFSPNWVANGDIPNGAAILSPMSSAGEGLSLLPCGGGINGVKLGAYAYSNTNGWKSMWETTNTGYAGGLPNLLLVKNGGNVGIGTGATAPRAKLDVNGKVIIGTTTQTGTHSDAMLTVDGKIVSKELVITLNNWADYVFASDYKLPKLSEVESFYKANNHLKDIPSEKEVLENGVSIGEMNTLLLKKIEELTLYMVEQNKKTESQELMIDKLEKKINELKGK